MAASNQQRKDRAHKGKQKIDSANKQPLVSIKDINTIPLNKLIAERPPSRQWGSLSFPRLFAAHKDVSSIDLHASPEQIASAFWQLRMKGLEEYEAHKWNHRFSRAMLKYFHGIGLKREVFSAIQGYHALKMRAYREKLIRNNLDTESGQRRKEYLKKYRAQAYAKKMSSLYASRHQINSLLSEALVESAASASLPHDQLSLILKNLMHQHRHRPTALEVEGALRSIIHLYSNRRHAARAMRDQMLLEQYSPDEIRLASGARTEHLLQVDARLKAQERFRQEYAVRSQDSEPTTSVVQLSDGEVLPPPSLQEGGVREVEHNALGQLERSDWWDEEYEQ